MRKLALLSLLLVTSSFVGPSLHGASLVIVDEQSYEIDSLINNYSRISALFLGGDTILSGSGAGIWAQFDETQPWQKLVVCAPCHDWVKGCLRRERFEQVFQPGQLWRVNELDETIVYEELCGYFLRLRIHDESDSYAELWRRGRDKDSFGAVSVQGSLMLSGAVMGEGDKHVVVSRTDNEDSYRRIVDITPGLQTKLDSVGLNRAFCYPAFNPGDSTIWFAVQGYGYVYVVDLEGRPLDSLEIVAPDYILPDPPISRIRSQAVHDHWVSSWTPVGIFRYVPPGYLILQYRIGWEKICADSIPVYSATGWSANREPAALEIDKGWQLAGVQPDGRVIFGRYKEDAGKIRVILTVTRIEP